MLCYIMMLVHHASRLVAQKFMSFNTNHRPLMFKFTDVLSNLLDVETSYNGLFTSINPVVISNYVPFPSKYVIHYYSLLASKCISHKI